GNNLVAAEEHFIEFGFHEGRHPEFTGFDTVQYLVNYSDLYAAFGTDLQAAYQHFVQFGYYEGRTDQIFTDANGIRRVAVEAANAAASGTNTNDVFVFTQSAATTGNASVTNFDPAHDGVALNHLITGFETPAAALATIAADPLNAGSPADTHIQLDANNSITLVGVHPDQLTQNNLHSY